MIKTTKSYFEFGGWAIVLRDCGQGNTPYFGARRLPGQQNVRCHLGAVGRTFPRDSIRHARLREVQPGNGSAFPPRRSGPSVDSPGRDSGTSGWMFPRAEQIGLDLALEQPHRFKSLTLVGATPSGFQLQGEPPRYLMEMFAALQSGNFDLANELQIRIWTWMANIGNQARLTRLCVKTLWR